MSDITAVQKQDIEQALSKINNSLNKFSDLEKEGIEKTIKSIESKLNYSLDGHVQNFREKFSAMKEQLQDLKIEAELGEFDDSQKKELHEKFEKICNFLDHADFSKNDKKILKDAIKSNNTEDISKNLTNAADKYEQYREKINEFNESIKSILNNSSRSLSI